MVLADQDGWDRYAAAKWLTMRRWLEANPDDFATDIRAKLTSEPERYATDSREYLGWGVFALMARQVFGPMRVASASGVARAARRA